MIRIHELGICCPVCGRDSWCLITDDGRFASCKRVSERSLTDLGQLGYLHFLPNGIDTSNFKPKERKDISYDEWERLQHTFTNGVPFMPDVGLRPETLLNYGIGWNPGGSYWTFPLYDTTGRICGMSTRYKDGSKACVSGTKVGVFMPRRKITRKIWAIAEGATDAGAVFEMGVSCLGKFNCETPHDIISEIVNTRIVPDAVVIIPDNDPHGAGLDGAEKLLPLIRTHCRIMKLPPNVKDVRQLYLNGTTKERFRSAVERTLL